MKCKHAKTDGAEIDIRNFGKRNNNNNFQRETTETSQILIKINKTAGKQLERFAQRQTAKENKIER